MTLKTKNACKLNERLGGGHNITKIQNKLHMLTALSS